MPLTLKGNVNAKGSHLFHGGNIHDKRNRYYKIIKKNLGYAVLSEVFDINNSDLTFSFRNSKNKNGTTVGTTISSTKLMVLGMIFIKPGSRYHIGRVNANDIVIIFDQQLSSDIDYTQVGQITFNQTEAVKDNTYNKIITAEYT